MLDRAGGDFGKIHLEDILDAAREGDGVSISVIRDTVKYLAMAVSNIAAVIDPDVIVLGGMFQAAEDLLLEPIRQECARRMPPAIQERARIEVSKLGPDAALELGRELTGGRLDPHDPQGGPDGCTAAGVRGVRRRETDRDAASHVEVVALGEGEAHRQAVAAWLLGAFPPR